MPLSVVWYRQDLRTVDHLPLSRAASSGLPLLCVFVADARLEARDPLGFPRVGPWRRRFLQQCLADLDQELRAWGHRLHVIRGEPEEVLPRLLAAGGGGRVFAHREPGTEEETQERALEALVPVDWAWGRTLLHPEDLPFDVADLPQVFSDFRRKVEGAVPVRAALPAPALHQLQSAVLPSGFGDGHARLAQGDAVTGSGAGFLGGRAAGLERLQRVVGTDGVLTHYKATRDALTGQDSATRLSPWLSAGALSPREVEAACRAMDPDAPLGPDRSWFLMELLWRDFFQFVALQQGARLFRNSGFGMSRHKLVRRWLTDDREPALAFAAWREGRTGEPMVDAAMRELAATGWLSNRARQLAAWSLARRTTVPWTWGARWFSSCLVDDDVASNWGNWAYLAGVGNDPRPDRHFDMEWQAARHDPDGAWRKLWGTWSGQ